MPRWLVIWADALHDREFEKFLAKIHEATLYAAITKGKQVAHDQAVQELTFRREKTPQCFHCQNVKITRIEISGVCDKASLA